MGSSSWISINPLIHVCLQKRKVLADPSLPPEFRISLAKSLRNDLFFQVSNYHLWCSGHASFRCYLHIFNCPLSADSVPDWDSGAYSCYVHSRGNSTKIAVVVFQYKTSWIWMTYCSVESALWILSWCWWNYEMGYYMTVWGNSYALLIRLTITVIKCVITARCVIGVMCAMQYANILWAGSWLLAMSMISNVNMAFWDCPTVASQGNCSLLRTWNG